MKKSVFFYFLIFCSGDVYWFTFSPSGGGYLIKLDFSFLSCQCELDMNLSVFPNNQKFLGLF